MPALPAGVSHVIVVSLTTTTFVAATPSNVTALVPGLLFWKPVPVRVTLVPPPAAPLLGDTEVSVGTGWKV